MGMMQSERFRRLSKEGLWVVAGQGMAVLGSLLGVRVITELLAPAAYGELALGLTVAVLVNQVVFGPLSNGITRLYAPAAEQNAFGGYLHAVSRLMLAATAVVICLMIFGLLPLWLAGLAQWGPLWALVLIFATLGGYNATLNGVQNAARQRTVVALHQGGEPWLRFLVAGGLMILLDTTSTVAMAGYAVATVPVLCSQYWFWRQKFPDVALTVERSGHFRDQIWRFSWPFSVFGIFTWGYFASDRWALATFVTTQEVGLYAALWQLGFYPMSMVTGMAMQFLAPIFYQRAGDASDSDRNAGVLRLGRRLTWATLALTGVVFGAAMLLHEQVFRVFVAAEYRPVSALLPWMLLAGGVFAAGQTISLNIMSLMRPRTMMTAKVVTAVLGILFNFVGVYWLGITGLVVASLLFSTLFLVWVFMLSVRIS